MTDYDVIIAGAGPAGLHLAKELAPHIRVLLVEKDRVGACQKVWLAWRENIERNNLDDCVRAKPTRIVVGSRTHGAAVLPLDDGDYVGILDEHAVLARWAAEAAEKGAHILENTELQGVRLSSHHILAETTQRSFAARLIIDATGSGSKLTERTGIAQQKYFYSFYGWTAELDRVDPSQLVLVQSFLATKPRPYVFFYPLGERLGAPIIFFITEQPMPLDRMRESFQYHLNQVPEVVENLAGFRPLEEKYGYIPLGHLRKPALDRVLFVGDAGRMAPSIIGSGFNFVLSEYRGLAERVRGVLTAGTLEERDLKQLTRTSRRVEDNLLAHKLALYDILSCRDTQLDNPMETRMMQMSLGCAPSDILAVLKAEASIDQLRSIVAHQAGSFSLGHLKGVLQLLSEEPTPGRLLAVYRLLRGVMGPSHRGDHSFRQTKEAGA